MSDRELAWAAGFYEGEGHFGVRHKPSGHPTALRLSVAQRTEEPLLRFHAAVGYIGKVQHRLIRGADFWNYVAGKTQNALDVAKLLWVDLSERRKDQILMSIDEFMAVRHIIKYDLSFFVENSEMDILDK